MDHSDQIDKEFVSWPVLDLTGLADKVCKGSFEKTPDLAQRRPGVVIKGPNTYGLNVCAAGQGDSQDGQAAAGDGRAAVWGGAVLCLTAALIRGWPSGIRSLPVGTASHH